MGNIVGKFILFSVLGYYLFIEMLYQKKDLYINQEFVLMVVWFLSCLVSGFFVDGVSFYQSSLVGVFFLLIYFIFSYSILLKSKMELDLLLFVYLFAVFFLFSYSFVFQRGWSGINSLTDNPNTLAVLGDFGFLILFSLFLRFKSILKRFIIVFFMLYFIYGIVLTGSRKGLFLIPLVLLNHYFLMFGYNVIYGENKFKTLISFLFKVLAVGLILGILVFFIKDSVYFERVVGLFDFLSSGKAGQVAKYADPSSYCRAHYVVYGLEIWKDYPFFGVGLDNFRMHINSYWTESLEVGKYAHNNYIELLSGIGLVGFVAYYGIYLSVFRKLFSVLKEKTIGNDNLGVVMLFLNIMLVNIILETAMVTYLSKRSWFFLLLVVVFTDKMIIKHNKEVRYIKDELFKDISKKNKK